VVVNELMLEAVEQLVVLKNVGCDKLQTVIKEGVHQLKKVGRDVMGCSGGVG
jgi:hypothetical protein